jgi:hypothetical protein
MLEPGDDEFDELLDLAERATGPGLLPGQRNRWRELVTKLLGKLAEAGQERRTGLRASASLPVQLLSPEEHTGLFTSTLSAGGVSLRLPDPLPKGTRVQLSINTGLRPAPILVSAEVVWSQPSPGMGAPGSMGVLFLDLFAADRELLEGIAITHLLTAALS